LIQPDAPLDLPIRATSEEKPVGPMADLRLKVAQKRQAAAMLTPPSARQGVLSQPNADLPLFSHASRTDASVDDGLDDRPLVSGNTPPRPPLAVRRPAPSTPAPPPMQRPRVEQSVPDEPSLDFAPWAEAVREESIRGAESDRSAVGDPAAGASAGSRLLGALIDVAITVGIDWAVLYFTLRLAGLQFSDIRTLPIVPMVGFLLLLNGGYLTMFTAAGGQTIGKMLAGTRVVVSDPVMRTHRLPFGTAVVMTAACLVSFLPAGIGFLMALFRADGRALHDAVADTRVVRA
jgi:uncharacterized RDD family membrane protein YckC